MKQSAKGVIICGIGGQGVVLVSNILTEGLMEMGFDVKKTEEHGMSQRNGAVNAQIKFGAKVFAPAVAKGSGDLIIAFEKAESLRWLEYLRPDGCLIVNDVEIEPVSVQAGKEKYPENLSEILRAEIADTIIINAAEAAFRMGTIRAQSMVLLGISVKKLELGSFAWTAKIRAMVPEKYQEANINAFQYGLSLV
ncbi:MAG: indolepyruvate oxidoreductase subunit beta [Gracilibacteraceae bacterium]|jgi:indolepyruvate ferredoxin oxidoreductase beta subunit|nr:indolepyruvate oxidoreductase subunit beta [Gracilibacteraceae bacterium]